jgi:uncharacterized phage protein (TIGR01671 family)
MREIKFRAWDKEGKRMIYDGIEFELMAMNKDKHRTDAKNIFIGFNENDYQNFAIMQFTGLLDKNGKPIYEGDRVRTWNGNRGTISYSEGYWRIGQRGRKIEEHEWNSFEVIGNIYEDKQ